MKPNKNVRRIAITGGIGSGKSTVSNILRRKGYLVLSCDEIYKEVIVSAEYLTAMTAQFAEAYFTEDGKIDREKLAKGVFENEQIRMQVNAISHPLIMRRLQMEMENVDDEIVFAEVPLLFEGGFEKQFDGVLVVVSNKEKRIKNIQKRDGLGIEEIEKRMQSQFDYGGSRAQAVFKECNAYILDNSSSLRVLEKKIESYLDILI